jgi:hypothetical protein
VLRREGHDRSNSRASIQAEQLGAMVALATDEQQSFLFRRRDVAVTTAELGGSVNYHGHIPRIITE